MVSQSQVSHFGDNLAREEKNIELKIRSGWIYERYRPSAWYGTLMPCMRASYM